MTPADPSGLPPSRPVDASTPLDAPTPVRTPADAPAAAQSAARTRCEGCGRLASLGAARLCPSCMLAAVVANGRLLTAEPTPAELRDRARRAARRRARRLAESWRRP